jgi:hypothetical protein
MTPRGSVLSPEESLGATAQLVDLPFEPLKVLNDRADVVYAESFYCQMILENRFRFSWRCWVTDPHLLLTICYVEKSEYFDNQGQK